MSFFSGVASGERSVATFIWRNLRFNVTNTKWVLSLSQTEDQKDSRRFVCYSLGMQARKSGFNLKIWLSDSPVIAPLKGQ